MGKKKSEAAPLVAAKPPREPSAQEEAFIEFQAVRTGEMKRHGVEPVADDAYQSAFINIMLRPFIAACRDEKEMALVFIEYSIADWPANYAPPWCFRVFTAPKVWRGLLDEVRARGE